MKNLAILCIALFLYSCNQPTEPKNKQLNQDLAIVTDSITQLMAQYHYNPDELTSDEYLQLGEKMLDLAKTVETKAAFIDGFNGLWQDGPFSHVRLGTLETPAAKMAEVASTAKRQATCI